MTEPGFYGPTYSDESKWYPVKGASAKYLEKNPTKYVLCAYSMTKKGCDKRSKCGFVHPKIFDDLDGTPAQKEEWVKEMKCDSERQIEKLNAEKPTFAAKVASTKVAPAPAAKIAPAAAKVAPASYAQATILTKDLWSQTIADMRKKLEVKRKIAIGDDVNVSELPRIIEVMRKMDLVISNLKAVEEQCIEALAMTPKELGDPETIE